MRPPEPIFYRCDRCGALARGWGGGSGNTFAGVTVWSDGIAEGPMLARPEPSGRRCPDCDAAVWTRDLARVALYHDDGGWDPRCNVVLRAVGPRPLAVNRAVRTALPLSVREAHAMIQEAPVPIAVGGYQVRGLIAALVEAGADAVDVGARGALEPYELAPLEADGYASLLDREPVRGGAPGDREGEHDRERSIRLEWWRLDNEPYRGDDRAWRRYDDRSAAVRANTDRLLALLGDEGGDRVLAAEILRQRERFDDALARLEPWTDDAGRPAAEAMAALVRARRPELVRLLVSSPAA